MSLPKISKSTEPKREVATPKFQMKIFSRTGAWSIAISFSLQSMLFYGTATKSKMQILFILSIKLRIFELGYGRSRRNCR